MALLADLELSLPPAFKLMLAAVQHGMGADDRGEFAKLLDDDPDWDQLEAVSVWHRLDGMLCQGLSRFGSDRAPDSVRNRLQNRAKAHAQKSFALTVGLGQIAQLFRENQIPFLQVKGLSLAQLAYAAPALRPSLDLDLMIAPRDVGRAIDLLSKHLGYRPFEAVSPSLDRYRTRVDYEIALHNENVSLDLHWAFSRFPAMFPIDFERTLASPTLVRIGKDSVPTLAIPDLIAYLCFHGAKHLWVKLFWIADLAGLIQNQTIDWVAVYDRAEHLRQTRTVTMGLVMAHQLFQSALPRQAKRAAAQDPKIFELVERIYQKIFDGDHAGRPYAIDVSFFEKMVWGTRVYASAGAKIAIAGSYIFRPAKADVQALPTPSFLFPILYLFRPIRLLAREVLKRLRGGRH